MAELEAWIWVAVACLKSPQIHCYQRCVPFCLCFHFIPQQNEPSSINGGQSVISEQTSRPLPGAEDYFLMISAHLDTVFLPDFFALYRDNGAMGGISLGPKHLDAIFFFALAFVALWTYGISAH
uniref:Uncharacterized protein n=1 Tax=Hippocampus comes TaxID=109280 RepID=A0A3Q2Y315_HIPCM